MDLQKKGNFLRNLILPLLIMLAAGFAVLIVGIILLVKHSWVWGGVLAGLGPVLIAASLGLALLLMRAIMKNDHERAKQIAPDAFFLYGDWVAIFTDAGMQIANSLHLEEEWPVVPISEIAAWEYYFYNRPTAKGAYNVTLAFPVRYLPVGLKRDRGENNAYFDVNEKRLVATLREYGVEPKEKAPVLEARPEKIMDYGDITVYDSGVFLEKLWIGEKSRFLPWEDVERVTPLKEEDELVFECGYQQFRTHYRERFWRDFVANFPEKAGDASQAAEDGE